MQTKGRFILCSMKEFDHWLSNTSINRAIHLVQNHHTWSPGYAAFTGENHLELLKGMESFHMKDRGFDMIAQNLTTFPDGKVAVCRPFDRIPAGIKGANQNGICIEHLGNFDSGKDSMTDLHRVAIVRVNALLCSKFGLTPSTGSIVYHHWYDLDSGKRTDGAGNTKTCPGTAFFGGNSVAAASTGFIPLVNDALAVSSRLPPPLHSVEVAADTLNVRAGAGISFAVLKKLRRGVNLPVYEEKDGWFRVAHKRQEWVSGKYVVPAGE